jgi:hypothetical protein
MTDEEKAAKAKAEAEAKALREAEEAAAKKKADEEKAAKAKAEAEAKEPKVTFHVVGPGAIMVGGEKYSAGKSLQLTKDEAKSLGPAVKAGPAPAAPEEISKRKNGDYVVAGPGCVWFEGKAREPGFPLRLTAEEAKKMGDAVKRPEAE